MRSKMKLLLLLKLVSVIGLTATTVRAERCTEHTRPHATRCDQYFRCVLLPSATPVWVPRQCEKGLIYDPQIKNCVVPGEDWECNLSAEVGDESGENVYGINNLPAAMYTGPPVLPTTVPPTPEKVSEGGPTKGSNHPAASGEKEGQATIYDNLRDQVINDSKYYNYQATLMDAYGNQYQTQQPLPNIQMYAYPPTMTYPMPNYQPSYQYPGNAFYNQAELNNRLRNSLGYEGEDSMSNEVALSDEEEADNSAELPETVATVNDNSNEKNEESDEQAEMKKLISVGGVTLNYNDYKDSILPLLDANPDEVRISVLTCTLGSRQPNKTDCTKYYVCNPHNGAFQSFTCPSFTAFNAETRICDTITYKSCQAIRLAGSATQQSSSSNRITTSSKHKHQPTTEASLKLKQELMTAQKYVDLIKKEAIKILSRNKVTTESGPDSNEVPQGIITNPTKSSSIGFTNPNTLLITNPTMSSFMPSITAPYIPPTMMVTTTTANNKRRRTKPKRKPTSYKKRTKGTGKTTSGRTTASTTTTTTTPKPVPKAPKCKRNGKMPDPAERRNYYVCYKASPKKFIKTRMACPGKLFYCPSTEYCTYEKECKNN
ncbi:uncharacterized protein LOC129732312 isoform X2 [Wyeomyia smithii]|uniref:uncharacterized protein LOC129732312 isoform X2 n=1 Tax=Wyeomyia smithii TaxID=174621 RepID=UPI0024680F38|nr:uncharacterized protein LOC129732312 isoform X2 [Wyeomyia smithii]